MMDSDIFFTSLIATEQRVLNDNRRTEWGKVLFDIPTLGGWLIYVDLHTDVDIDTYRFVNWYFGTALVLYNKPSFDFFLPKGGRG
jgi:hypothetical protein